MDKQRHGQELVTSYLNLRAAIGGLAFVLALLAPILWLVEGRITLLSTISDSYYTSVGPIFVGGLSAIGVFLAAYRGYDLWDRVASGVAGVSAILVAQFPCHTESKAALMQGSWATAGGSHSAAIHYISAIVLFVALAIISAFIFTKSRGQKTRKKELRNGIYYACAAVIAGGLIAIGIHAFVSPFLPPGGIYAVEAFMVVAFGLSWATKGEALWFLNDPVSEREEQKLQEQLPV